MKSVVIRTKRVVGMEWRQARSGLYSDAMHAGACKILTVAMAAVLICASLVNRVHAAPGDLDPRFGGHGTVLTAFPGFSSNEATAVALQPDDKIVAAGTSDSSGSFDFALVRYHPNGTLDGTFGSGGRVLTAFSGTFSSSDDEAFALALQPDGKIIAAGISNARGGSFDFALARYNPNGTLDGTFGSGGTVLTDLSGSGDTALALALQPDGKIVVAGVSDAGGANDFVLVRYNPDGSLDGTFGSGGIVRTDLSGAGSFDFANALALQPDGKIVVAGFSDAGGAPFFFDFAVVRYNPNGTLDGTFGSGGIVLTVLSGTASSDFANALALQSDGKIVVAGQSFTGVSEDFAVVRYNPDGSLDGTFGSGGIVRTDLSGAGSDDGVHALALQSDGKIVAAGASFSSGSSDFALVRYNRNGTLDSTFGSGGRVLTNFFFSGSNSDDRANAVALQPDGKIVAAGGSNVRRGASDFALARYQP